MAAVASARRRTHLRALWLCALYCRYLPLWARAQTQSPDGRSVTTTTTDVRQYTQASILGDVDVHAGELAGGDFEWRAWRRDALRNASLEEAPDEERTVIFESECLTNSLVTVRTPSASNCTCDARNVEAHVRLGGVATLQAGLAEPLLSTRCLVNVMCNASGMVSSVAVTRCALESDVDVVLKGGSLPLAVELFAFDSQRRRVEIFASFRGGDGALYAKAAYRVSTSQDATSDGVFWQVAARSATTLGIVAQTLGTPYANFHRRFGLPRSMASRADADSINITSFVAKLSARRSIVAAAMAYHDGDLDLNVYATGQVDGDGRLNAYDVRRVKGALTLREVAGGKPRGQLYSMDHDVCGTGWDVAANERIYLTLDVADGNIVTAQGQKKLACAGLQMPPVPFSEATFVAPAVRLPSHLIDSICCLSGSDVVLERTMLRYEDIHANADFVASFGVKQLLHLTGRKILQASSHMMFTSVGIISDDEIVFKAPTFRSPHTLPIMEFLVVANDAIGKVIRAAIPYRPNAGNESSLLAMFELAPTAGLGKTVIRLNGTFEGNMGSFMSTTTLRAGSCQSVESFVGSWTTASGDVVTFDTSGDDLCSRASAAIADRRSSYTRATGHAAAWAPALSSSSAWNGMASAVCKEEGDTSTPQAYRVDVTMADSSDAEVEVNIAGMAKLKSEKVSASVRMDVANAWIYTTSRWTSQDIANPPQGYVSILFEDASVTPTVALATPTTADNVPESLSVPEPHGINFVDSTLRLFGAVGQISKIIPAATPNASSIYKILQSIRIRYDESDCVIDMGAAGRSVTCAGAIAEQQTGDERSSGLSKKNHALLRAKSANVVSDYIERGNGTESVAMIGIATEHEGAAAMLQTVDSRLSNLVHDELFVESSSMVIASAPGAYINVNPSPAELQRSRETSPLSGAKAGLFSPRSRGSQVTIPRAGVFLVGRLDRSRGAILELSRVNSRFSKMLLEELFYCSCGRAAYGIGQLDSVLNSDASKDRRIQFATKLRGRLLFPNYGLVLQTGGSFVIDMDAETYTQRTLLRGKYRLEFEHATPISFKEVPDGGKDRNDGIAWVRAEGDLIIRKNTGTGKLNAGGLLVFSKLGSEHDPDSLFLSPAIKFREGTVGVSTDFQAPYLKCFGLAVSSSWSMLPRDKITPVEEYYRHEVKIHMATMGALAPASRVVDAFVIEAIVANVTALELMEPFVDIASTVNFTAESRNLLESAFIVGARIVVNEGRGEESVGTLNEGCLTPPKGSSAIHVQEVEIGGLRISNSDGTDMVLRLDLSDAGPGSYDMTTERSKNKVVASGDLVTQIYYIGSYKLDPIDTQDTLDSKSDGQGVRSFLSLSTEDDDDLELQFSIDAMVTTLGIPWYTRITHMSQMDASNMFLTATAIPESFKALMGKFVFYMSMSFDLPSGPLQAGLVTSTDDSKSPDMKSYFGLQLNKENNQKTLELYASEVDNVVIWHWEQFVSEIEAGMSSEDSTEQTRICRSHPLRFGACVAAAFYALKSGNLDITNQTTTPSRRSLLNRDSTSSADEVANALAKAAKELRASAPGVGTRLKHIHISGVNACPMSKAEQERELLRTEQIRLARCLLTSDSPKVDCAERNLLVMELQQNASLSWHSTFASWGESENSKVYAEVLGSVADGVEKRMHIEIDNIHTESVSKAIFTAFLDDVHAAFAKTLATHIKGSYRAASAVDHARCEIDSSFVYLGFPLKNCSKYPPPASAEEAFSSWKGWNDLAGLLDLARALQRDAMTAGGFIYPLTSLGDSEGIVHDSFTITAIVASSSSEKSPTRDSSDLRDSLMQRFVDAGIVDDLRTAECGEDGNCIEGEQAFREHRMEYFQENSDYSQSWQGDGQGVQLGAFTASGLYQHALVKAFSALTSPSLWRNRTFVSDVVESGHVDATAWGCVISLQKGMYSARFTEQDAALNRSVTSALRIVSRDIMGMPMADCGPGREMAGELASSPSNNFTLDPAISAPLLSPNSTSRRSVMSIESTMDSGEALVPQKNRLARCMVVVSLLASFVPLLRVMFSRAIESPHHRFIRSRCMPPTRIVIIVFVAVATTLWSAMAQDTMNILYAGRAIDTGVRLSQKNVKDQQDISWTLPAIDKDGFVASEMAFRGKLTFLFFGHECYEQDWGRSFDQDRTWNECASKNHMITGLMRSGIAGKGAFGLGSDNLNNIEKARCCYPRDEATRFKGRNLQCHKEYGWSQSLDGKGWSVCRKDHYLEGLYRGGCNKVYCIEEAFCCNHEGITMFDCEDITGSIFWGKRWGGITDEVQCPEGKVMTALYRAFESEGISDIRGIRCCSYGIESDFSQSAYEIQASAVSAGSILQVVYFDKLDPSIYRRLDISDVSVDISKKSGDEESWTLRGSVAGMKVTLSAGAKRFESLRLDGSMATSTAGLLVQSRIAHNMHSARIQDGTLNVRYDGMIDERIVISDMRYDYLPNQRLTLNGMSGGGLKASLDIENGRLKELKLKGAPTRTDSMNDFVGKLRSVFGKRFDIATINDFRIGDGTDIKKLDFVHADLMATIFGHGGSLRANFAESPAELKSFFGSVQINDDTLVEFSGTPFCRTDSTVQGAVFLRMPGEVSGKQMLEFDMSAMATCSGDVVTSITMQASTKNPDTTYSFRLGLFSPKIKRISVQLDYDYSSEAALTTTLSGELTISSIPTSFRALISSDIMYEITIGAKDSSESVDWDDIFAQISDAEGSAAIMTALPSIFISGVRSLRFFDCRIMHDEEESITSYALDLSYDMSSIAISARLEADTSSSSTFSVHELDIQAERDHIKLSFMYSDDPSVESGYAASLEVKQQIGEDLLYISPFVVEGKVHMSQRNFELQISSTKDIIVGIAGTEFTLKDADMKYESESDVLMVHASLSDIFAIDFSIVLGLSAKSESFKMTGITFSADYISLIDLGHLGNIGKYIMGDFANKDGSAAIHNLKYEYDNDLGEHTVAMDMDLVDGYHSEISVAYDQRQSHMKSINAVISTDWMALRIQGTSLCGNDGAGGSLPASIELQNLPFGISTWSTDADVNFRCELSDDGQSHGIDSFAISATMSESSLSLKYDAFSISLANPSVSFDSAIGHVSFRADVADGAVALRFDYANGDDMSEVLLTMETIQDISFDRLEDALMTPESKKVALKGLSDSYSNGLGSDVKKAYITNGATIQVGKVVLDGDTNLRLAIVGAITLYGADLRMMFIADDITNDSRRRVLLSIEVTAEASSLPNFIRDVWDTAGGGDLHMRMLIANEPGEYLVPYMDADTVTESHETIDMEGVFVIKITPGGNSQDPFEKLKSDDSPFAMGTFEPGFYVAVEKFNPLEFSVYVAVALDVSFGETSNECATITSIRDVKVGISVASRSVSFFVASRWNILIPKCDESSPPRREPGKEPTSLDMIGKLDIIIPNFELRGTISLDAGEAGWNNPFDVSTKLTIYQVHLSLGFSFKYPFLMYVQFYARAQLGVLEGDVLLALKVHPHPPEAAFSIQLENVDVVHLISVLVSEATGGSSDDAGIFGTSMWSEKFMYAGSYHAWLNSGDEIQIGEGNEKMVVKSGFGVVAKDVSLLWGLFSAREVSFVLELRKDDSVSIEMFTDFDPINVLNVLKIKGRHGGNPVALVELKAGSDQGAETRVCLDGKLDFLGMKFGLTVFMNIATNGASASCYDRLQEKGVKLSKPELPAQYRRYFGLFAEGPGIYMDASFQWGKIRARALFAGNWNIWDVDASLMFYFTIHTTNDRDILATVVRQCVETLVEKMKEGIEIILSWGMKAIEYFKEKIRQAQAGVQAAKEEVARMIEKAKAEVNRLQGPANWHMSEAEHNENECAWYQPWYCVAAGYHWAMWGVNKALIATAQLLLDMLREAVEAVLTAAQFALKAAYDALRLGESAINLLKDVLHEALDTINNVVDLGLEGMESVVKISRISISARIGTSQRRRELGMIDTFTQMRHGDTSHVQQQDTDTTMVNHSSTARSLLQGFVDCGNCHGAPPPPSGCCNTCQEVIDAWNNWDHGKNWLSRATNDDVEKAFEQCNCGVYSCFGAAKPGVCCRTCDEVKQKYSEKGWALDETKFRQCCDCSDELWNKQDNLVWRIVKSELTKKSRQACCKTCYDAKWWYREAVRHGVAHDRSEERLEDSLFQCLVEKQRNAENVHTPSTQNPFASGKNSYSKYDELRPSATLGIQVSFLKKRPMDLQLEVNAITPEKIALAVIESLSERVISFLLEPVPEDIKDILMLDGYRRRKWQRRQAETVNCTNPAERNLCYPECCDDSNEYFTAQDSRDARDRISGGHDVLGKLGSGVTEKDVSGHSMDCLLSARAIFHHQVGASPPYSASEREKPRPKARVFVSYKPGSENDAKNEALGRKLRRVLQDEIDRSTDGLESSQLTPQVIHSCEHGCGTKASNGLWRLEAGPLYFSDVPAVMDAIVSRQAQTKIRNHLVGYGSRLPHVVEIAGGSAEHVFQELPGSQVNLTANEGVVALAAKSYYMHQVCGRAEDGDIKLADAGEEEERGLSIGMIVGIAVACFSVVFVVFAVVVFQRRRRRMREERRTYYADLPKPPVVGNRETASFHFSENGGEIFVNGMHG